MFTLSNCSLKKNCKKSVYYRHVKCENVQCDYVHICECDNVLIMVNVTEICAYMIYSVNVNGTMWIWICQSVQWACVNDYENKQMYNNVSVTMWLWEMWHFHILYKCYVTKWTWLSVNMQHQCVLLYQNRKFK